MKRGNNTETATAFVNMSEMIGSNFYAFGDICKSYNTIIASHQNGVILLNSRDYSNTTQRHKLHIWSAAYAQRVTLFEVPVCYNWHGLTNEQHAANIEYLKGKAEEARRKGQRARTRKAAYFAQAERYTAKAEEYKRIFKLA